MVDCSSLCDQCSGATSLECINCATSAYSHAADCLATCPSQFYPIDSTSPKTCGACDPSCLECSGPTTSDCVSCPTGAYLLANSNTCYTDCPSGFYEQPASQTCEPCHAYCATCTGPLKTECQSCSLLHFFTPALSSCHNLACPTGTYLSGIYECSLCDPSCLQCAGALNSQCSECADGYYLDFTTCTACDPSCLTCTGPDSNHCTSCSNPAFLTTSSTCELTCPSQYFPNTATQQCQACNAHCDQCTGPSNTECVACQSGSVEVSGPSHCDATCPSGTYADASEKCQPCHSDCATCTGPLQTECPTCAPTKVLKAPNHCDSACFPQMYADSSFICQDCDALCDQCTGPANTECVFCQPTAYVIGPSHCDTACPSKTYANSSNNCIDCHTNCAECSGPADNQCASCIISPTVFSHGPTSCLTTCPDGTYANTSTQTCDVCHSNCATCSGPSDTDCLTCAPGAVLKAANHCGASCFSQFYPDSSSVCQACNSHCAECSGPLNTECAGGCQATSVQVASNHCDASCPAGTYADPSNICQNCDAHCATCSGALNSQCLTCNYALPAVKVDATTCASACPSKFYPDASSQCQDCHPDCAECTGPLNTECTACVASSNVFALGATSCVTSCPSDTFPNTSTQICENCHANCQTCFGSTKLQCHTCAPGKLLKQPNHCGIICFTQMYPDASLVCQDCDPLCDQCTGPANTECVACATGKYEIAANHCDHTCPAGTYHSATYTCPPCDASCALCTGPNSTECSQCVTGFYLQPDGSTCSATCPSGYFANTSTLHCEACHAYCAECTGPTNTQCSACVTPNIYQVSATKCDTSCESHQYPDNATWTCPCKFGVYLFVVCNIHCATCTGPLNTDCTSCTAASFDVLADGTHCDALCPSHFYPDSSLICRCKLHIYNPECHANCKQCTGPSNTECEYVCNGINSPDPASSDFCNDCQGSGLYLSNHNCPSNCPAGKYPEPSENLCKECHDYCEQCTGATHHECDGCSANHYLVFPNMNTCDVDCDLAGISYFENDLTNTCDPCHPLCFECSSQFSSPCAQCNDFIAYRFTPDDACVTSCPPGYFADPARVCQGCDSTCDTCSTGGPTSCETCYSGYFFYQGQCLQTCPDGYWGNEITLQCEPCQEFCLTCFGPSFNQCFSCNGFLGYILKKYSCLRLQCSTGGYPVSGMTPYCDECTGPTQFECTQCNESRLLKDNQCLPCDEVPGLRSPPSGLNQCLEICGDGINIGVNQCDDGNIFDGDGCSGTCIIQEGFRCSGGSPTAPDVCIDIIEPYPLSLTIDLSFNLNMTFIEPVVFTRKPIATDFTVKLHNAILVDLPSISVRDINIPTQKLSLDLKFAQPISGQGQVFEIGFVNAPELFSDLAGNLGDNNPLNITLPYYFFLSSGEQQFVEVTSKTFSTATMSGLMINLGISMLLGTTMESMWSLLHAVQLLNFLPLINVEVPINMRVLFEVLGFANMDVKVINGLFTDYMIESESLAEEPYNDHFAEYGIDSHSILVNSAEPLMLWAIVVFTFPFSLIFSQLLPCDKGKRAFKSIIQGYTYNTLLRALIQSYLDLIVSVSVNLTSLNLNNKTEMLSSGLSLFFAFVLFSLPFFIVHKLSIPHRQLYSENKRQEVGVLYEDLNLRNTSPWITNYYTIFIFRRMLFGLVLVYSTTKPLVQIGLIGGSSVLVLIYLVLAKPMNNKVINFLEVFNECLFLAITLALGSLHFEGTMRQNSKDIGWFCISLMCCCILLNIGLVIPRQMMRTLERVYHCCNKKAKVKARQKQAMKLIKRRHSQRKKWNRGIDVKLPQICSSGIQSPENSTSVMMQKDMLSHMRGAPRNFNFNVDLRKIVPQQQETMNNTQRTQQFDDEGSVDFYNSMISARERQTNRDEDIRSEVLRDIFRDHSRSIFSSRDTNYRSYL